MSRKTPARQPMQRAAPQRSAATGPLRARAASATALASLQRAAGNRAMHRLLGTIQPKLTVNRPDDEYEREADRAADEVMRMPEPVPRLGRNVATVQRTCAACAAAELEHSGERVSRKCAECERHEGDEDPDKHVQKKRETTPPPEATDRLAEYLRGLGGGRPLSPAIRTDLESRLGHGFQGVRVHDDAAAAASARSIGARAYTFGRHVVFAAGEFAPSTSQGRRLLAHELTHVIQQGQARPSAGDRVLRKVARESTVEICRRELTSKNVKVSEGGLRVVLLLKPLDTDVSQCQNHKFWVTLTRAVDWGFDDEIATCEAETGGTRSFSFANLSAGTYYVTIRRAFDHPYCCIEGDILILDEAISGDSSGCVRDVDPSVMDIVHGALDIAGFIPVLGAIPDGINAGIYAIEGDWANAGLSAVAMVPGWGDGIKLGAIGTKNAIKISKKAAFRMGEEGIATGLKEIKAASRVEKAAVEAGAEGSKAVKAEAHAAEGATKAEKEAAEKAEREAAEKRKKDQDQKKTCATKYPAAINCIRLPLFTFPSPQAALAFLKLEKGKKNLRLVSDRPSIGGPCEGVGKHYGVKDDGGYIASISCCPCCIETAAGPKMVTRCRIL